MPIGFSFLKITEKQALTQLLNDLNAISDTSGIIVTDAKSLNEAALSISQYKMLDKKIEKTRKLITEPLNGLVKEANNYFKSLLIQSPIPLEVERLNKEVLNYNAAEKKKTNDLRKAEEARLEEEALNHAIACGKDEPAIVVETVIPDYKVSQNTAYITTAKLKKWRVTDLTLIPHSYFILNETAINTIRRLSKPEDISSIPGIEYYTEDSLRTK